MSETWPPMVLLFIPQMIYERGEPRLNDLKKEKLITGRETCPSATLSTINLEWTDGAKGENGEKLSYRITVSNRNILTCENDSTPRSMLSALLSRDHELIPAGCKRP
jgi:hypothetical protein